MIQSFQVHIYSKMSFHWKAQALILLIIISAGAVAKLFLPEWIVQNRSFELLLFIPFLFIFYRKYLNKSFKYAQEPLTISADKVNFRSVVYLKSDIGFYRYKVRGATYGSVIKLGNEVTILCNNMDLPEYKMYDGDYSTFKRINLAIEQDTFDALKKFKFNTI